MTKFTKGPWRWDRGALMGADGSAVAMADFDYDHDDFVISVDVDDASLLEASLDLYEALSLVDRKLKLEALFTGDETNQILSALAKARGE